MVVRVGGLGWVGARSPNSAMSTETELPRPSNHFKYQGRGEETVACKGTFQKSFKLPMFLLPLESPSKFCAFPHPSP